MCYNKFLLSSGYNHHSMIIDNDISESLAHRPTIKWEDLVTTFPLTFIMMETTESYLDLDLYLDELQIYGHAHLAVEHFAMESNATGEYLMKSAINGRTILFTNIVRLRFN